MSVVHDVAIGGHRWSITADDARPARIIGVAYRVRPAPSAGLPTDLRVTILQDPSPHADPPVTAAVDATAAIPRIELRVHDPDLDDLRLHYFLWVNINASLVRLGQFLIHAASFTIDDRLVLVTGPSGAGKSTLALAAGLAGAVVHSDDWSIARRGDDGIEVSGVTSTMRITDATRERIGHDRLHDAVRSQDEKRKWVFDAGTIVTASPGANRVPDRIVLLRTGSRTSTRPASAGEVARHLFEEAKPTMYLPDPAGLAAYLDCCTTVATSAPAVHVERDADADSLDELIAIVRSA